MAGLDFAMIEAAARPVLMAMPRLLPVFFILPVFSGQVVLGMVRNSLILLMAIFVAPSIAAGGMMQMAPFVLVGLIVKELLIGFLLAFAFSIFLWAIQSAGHLIDFQSGTANAAFFDPVSGHEGGPTATFLTYLAVALFMAGGGFEATLGLIFESYRIWPPESFLPNIGVALEQFAMKEGDSLAALTVKLAAPVVLVLVVVELGLGLVNRIAPNLNVFTVAPPLKGALSMLMLALFLQFIYDALRSSLNPDSGMLAFLRSLIER
jgi:type III secretion protein T